MLDVRRAIAVATLVAVAVLCSPDVRSDSSTTTELERENIAFLEVAVAHIIDFFDFSYSYTDVTSSLYLWAAELGNSGAQATIADRYLIGYGVAFDPDEAVKWWERAAEQSNLHALEMLVEHYRKTNDHIAQIKWTRLAAEAGVLRGQVMLGWYYQRGVGLERDTDLAIKWYSLAAERGDPLAYTNLATIYEGRQKGDPQDLAKAYDLHIKAIELGSTDGLRHLTWLIRHDKGSREDRSRGFDVVLQEAKKGIPVAQLYAGKMLLEGKGTARNVEEAVQWFLKSANAGIDDAQLELAACYAHGTGVPQDLALALYWRTAAANQRNAFAQYLVSLAYAHGEGVVVDDGLALRWLRSAAANNDYHAQYALGLRYFNGEGVEKNPNLAIRWFRRAARQGDRQSIDALVRTYFEYSTTSDDIANGLMWLHISAHETPERRASFAAVAAAEQDPTRQYMNMYGEARAVVWEDNFRATGGKFLPRSNSHVQTAR